ncbi:MAG: GTPase (G3E family) [Butyrivibrio sp.]|nr:GTPase (G3E family) [Butyrivibrio sp.]
MIKLDLITGFLGAGKTTFIKLYASRLLEEGIKVCVIENDYGAINIDRVLLKDIEEKGGNVEMIIGGDGREAHKRRLKTKLIAMAMDGYERVIIEPSGVFDMDEFYDLLYEEPLDRLYEIGNVIAIVEKSCTEGLSPASRYVLMSETACAGIVVVSRVLEGESGLENEIAEDLNKLYLEYDCSRKITKENVVASPWQNLTSTQIRRIVKCGFNKASYPKKHAEYSEFGTIFYFDFSMDTRVLSEKIRDIFKDSDCGEIIRIKGIVKDDSGKMTEVNATSLDVRTAPIESEVSVLIIIGEKLNKAAISRYFGEPSI